MDTLDSKNVEKIRKNALEAGQSCYQALVLDAPVAQLPETVFSSVFLPYFTGQKNLVEDNDLLIRWIGIAGSESGVVDVISQSGDVLFRVPPLFGTTFINPGTANSLPFDGIFNEYFQLNATLPAQGERLLKNVLALVKKAAVTNDYRLNEYKDMWYKIFKFYNIPFPEEVNAASSTGIDDNEIEY